MEAVCRWRASQGGPPQAADDGRTGDEISGGKMHPGPDHLSTTTCQPVLSCPSFYTGSPSHPPVRLSPLPDLYPFHRLSLQGLVWYWPGGGEVLDPLPS